MRTLWRTTVYLFWQYPILWLPVVFADLLAFCLRLLQNRTTHAIIQNLVAGRSVLGNTTEPLRALTPAWASLFAASRLLIELLNIYLYAAAMIAVSILIPALIALTKPPWQQIPFAVKQSRIHILILSLKLFGMLLVGALLGAVLIVYLPKVHFLPLLFANDGYHGEVRAIVALFLAATAWLIAPSAFAILRPHESPPTDAASLRNARNFAALTPIGSAGIYFLATILRPSFTPLLPTPVAMNVFWGVASAISAIPYVLLFIALSLIANPDRTPAVPRAPENPAQSSAQTDIISNIS